MKRTQKQILLIVGITLLLIAAIVVAYILMRKKETPAIVAPQTDTIDASESTTQVLKYGSRGAEVTRLQKFLNAQLALMIWKGYPSVNGKEIRNLAVDGIFGKETQAAVQWYFNSSTVNTTQF